MVQRPASPTSLLWAHQLKKEHAHLLDRMKALEATSKDVVARMAEAEATTAAARESVTRVADMAARIAAIEEDDDDVRQWIAKLNEERQAQTRKEDDKLQSLTRRVELLDAENKKLEVEQKEAKRRDDDILKRLEQLEAAREAAREADKRAADKLIRKNDPVDKVLSRRLDAFESRRNEDSTKIAALLQKIKALESSNQELSTKTQQIQKKLESARTPRNHVLLRQKATDSISTGTTQMGTPLVTSPNVQVARSPLVNRQLRSHSAVRPLQLQTPQLQTPQLQTHAMLRRSSRAAPRSEILANRLLRAARGHSPTSGTGAPNTTKEPADLANSRKKRKAALTEEVRETQNVVKTLEPALKPAAPTLANNQRHEPQISAAANAKPPQNHLQKKRRQIVQLHDI
ncbi:hypothetical protein H2199_001436 [Coniosporium tulheliwenetii]|uniref:Uncharacterized protein n=1 Tax=Coniosporium tulheliwenetii TaxID=3383036 RepID=A0ACC2ZM88_9PEZI|nr:hypothetical protein H2199_001436 [Cladosporium sp. JES 115]